MNDIWGKIFIGGMVLVFCALGYLIYTTQGKWDECRAKGGYVVELTNGYICAKLEVIK